MPRTTIVISTSDHLLMLKHSLHNLIDATPGHDWDLVVIDDVSTDGTSEWLGSNRLLWLPSDIKYQYIKLDSKYICGSFGKGISQIKLDSEFMVLMDDDVVYRPYRWLEIALEYFTTFPQMGVCLLLDHGYYEFFEKNFGKWDNIYRDLTPNFGHGFCQIVRTEDYIKSGGARQDPGRYAQDAHFQMAVYKKTNKRVYGFWRPMLVHLGNMKEFYYQYAPFREKGELFK